MRPHSALIQHLLQELYLDDQWKFDADILRFGTTHEHYKTVEYEPDAAIGGGDSARYSVCLHAAASILYNTGQLCGISPCWTSQTTKQNNSYLYLHHQWSHEADILQSCSTHEYFETVEYEHPAALGRRVTA